MAALVLLLSLSVCCRAAQIDSLSVRDGVLDAYVTGLPETDETKLYVAEEEADGVVSAVNSYPIENGKAEGTFTLTNDRTCKIYVWDETLSPLMLSYDLIGGRAYAANGDICVPQSSVIVVSEVSGGLLKGYEAGNEVQYFLTESVEVTGLASDISNVLPGSVVAPLFDREERIVSLELLAGLDGDNDEALLKANCGEHAAADGSERYANVVGVYYSTSINRMTVRFVGDEFEDGDEKHTYTFESAAKRYVVHMSDSGALEKVDVSADWSGLQEIDGSGLVYVYLRCDTADDTVTEAVFYYFTEDADITDGGEYSEAY